MPSLECSSKPQYLKTPTPRQQRQKLVAEKVLIFINPKCKVYRWVLGVSSAGNCVSNYQSSLEHINLGEIKGEGGKTKLRYKHRTSDLELWFYQWMNQLTKTSHNLPKPHYEQEMVGCTIKYHPRPLSRVIRVTTYFRGVSRIRPQN